MRRIGSWLWPWLWTKGSVFLAAALFSLPGAVRLAQRTYALAALPYEERRARVLDESYSSLRAQERMLPPGDLSVLLLGPHAIDRGIFINYHLYPRASHLYFDAIPADAPRRPLLVTEAHGEVRRTIVKEPRASSDAHRQLLVPLVAAIQGGDGYMTEGVLESDRDTSVTLTLMPGGKSRTYALQAHEPLILTDLVHDAFGAMTTGWLRIHASEPVRAAFWFVNRGRAAAAPLELFADLPPLPHRFAGGEKLWIVNPSTTAVTARVNGHDELVEGGALRMLGGGERLQVDASAPLLSFTSSKESDGNTRFVWPGGKP